MPTSWTSEGVVNVLAVGTYGALFAQPEHPDTDSAAIARLTGIRWRSSREDRLVASCRNGDSSDSANVVARVRGEALRDVVVTKTSLRTTCAFLPSTSALSFECRARRLGELLDRASLFSSLADAVVRCTQDPLNFTDDGIAASRRQWEGCDSRAYDAQAAVDVNLSEMPGTTNHVIHHCVTSSQRHCIDDTDPWTRCQMPLGSRKGCYTQDAPVIPCQDNVRTLRSAMLTVDARVYRPYRALGTAQSRF